MAGPRGRGAAGGRRQLLRRRRYQRARRPGRGPRAGARAAAGSRSGARFGAHAGPHLLPLSAATPAALARLGEDLAERFAPEEAPAAQVPAVAGAARTLAGRRRHKHRRAVVVRDAAHAAEALRPAAAASAPRTLGKVAFLFPGQGTLKEAAGEAAYRLLPGFRAAFDEVRKLAADDCGVDLGPVVDPAGPAGPGAAAGAEDWSADTVHQQLGLFALGFAFGRQLREWGVTPTAMLGNSIGEYAAAALAEVWTLPDAVGVVHLRARAMRDAAPGRMAVVGAPAEEVEPRLPAGCGVTVAVRGNGTAVLSGSEAAVDRLLAGETLHGLRVTPVHTRRAFHSPAMDPAAEAVRAHLSSMPSRPPRLPYISNTTGGWADPDTAGAPETWAAHLREPVLLDAGTATLLAAGCTTYVELGPGGSMTGPLRCAPGWNPAHTTVRLAPGGRTDAETGLLEALGALWELGVDGALEAVHEARYADAEDRPPRCSLPGHPFLGEDPEEDLAAGPADGEPARTAPSRAAPSRTAPSRAGSSRTDPSRTGPAAAASARAAAPAPAVASVPAAPTGPGPLRAVLEEVWCRTLGVAAVADDDDFFTLGGESLLALALTTAVRERTGAEVSVTEFSLKGTFGGLLGLVAPRLPEPAAAGSVAAGPRPAAGPVALREGGGRPVFLVSDASGNALPYRALAALIAPEGDRPVLALERSARAGRGGPRSIEALAAAHVATLLHAQPAGPLTLGGWSFGAVVAHETARQLALRGREVDLLLALDGYLPDTGRLPVAAAPEFLLGGARAGLDTLLGVGPLAALHRRSPELRRRFLAGQAAVLAHRPRAVACPAVLFKADSDPAGAARLEARLAGLYPAGLRVRPVGGNHWSMLTPPHVGRLAAHISEVLPAGIRSAPHKERKHP